MSDELDAVLQSKTDWKSQACALWKKENGILTWVWINGWYMQTTGMGMAERRKCIMSPTQSKSDAEVMYEVQKWKDEGMERSPRPSKWETI